MMHKAPGGPFDKDNNKKQVEGATLNALNTRFGLDKPQYFNPAAARSLWNKGVLNPFKIGRAYLDSQFFNYIINAMHGDLGPSYTERTKDVQDILRTQWPFSLRLGLFALAFALLVGIPLGVIAALRQNSIVDYLSLFFATVGVSVPSFVTGLLVIILFGTKLGWIAIATNNWTTWPPYLAPGLVLGFGSLSFITRIMRTTMLEVKHQEYVRTAYAKGLGDRRIVTRHMLRNALIPVVTLLGPELVNLVVGATIIEAIFGIPGIGKYFVDAIGERDYSMIMGTTLVYAALIVLANLLVDLSYGFLDPRIRQQR